MFCVSQERLPCCSWCTERSVELENLRKSKKELVHFTSILLPRLLQYSIKFSFQCALRFFLRNICNTVVWCRFSAYQQSYFLTKKSDFLTKNLTFLQLVLLSHETSHFLTEISFSHEKSYFLMKIHAFTKIPYLLEKAQFFQISVSNLFFSFYILFWTKIFLGSGEIELSSVYFIFISANSDKQQQCLLHLLLQTLEVWKQNYEPFEKDFLNTWRITASNGGTEFTVSSWSFITWESSNFLVSNGEL